MIMILQIIGCTVACALIIVGAIATLTLIDDWLRR